MALVGINLKLAGKSKRGQYEKRGSNINTVLKQVYDSIPQPVLGWRDEDRQVYAYELLERAALRSGERAFVDQVCNLHYQGGLSPKQRNWYDDIVLRYESTVSPCADDAPQINSLPPARLA